MTTLEDKQVRIRKSQSCFGCAREFKPGDKLRYIKAVDQSSFSSSYWCKTCSTYWSRHMDSEDEISFGDLRHEDLQGWEKVKQEIESA